MFSFKRASRLFTLSVVMVLLLTGVVPTNASAFNGNIESEFDMADNPTFTPGIEPPGVEVHGFGTFEMNGEDLDNLLFKYRVQADDLDPKTWYQATITIRDLQDPNTDGPDDTVIVGWHKTNANGSLNFVGKAVLPDPTITSPQGVTAGWRIDQQLRRPGANTNLGNCQDCVLVCSPTTKVQLNASQDGLIPA